MIEQAGSLTCAHRWQSFEAAMAGTQRSHAEGGRVCVFSLRQGGDKLEIAIAGVKL